MNRLEEIGYTTGDEPTPTENRLIGLGAPAADCVIESSAVRCGQGKITCRLEPHYNGLWDGRERSHGHGTAGRYVDATARSFSPFSPSFQVEPRSTRRNSIWTGIGKMGATLLGSSLVANHSHLSSAQKCMLA